MKIHKHVFLFLALLGLAPLAAWADGLGDPAPELAVREWIKGGPVEVKPGTNIYVVVIWNTKSASNSNAIPVLNDVQKTYKAQGVVVVGISDESADRIRSYVMQTNVHIDFAVGADIARRTSIAYMLGFKLRSVPTAFVVGKDGKFLWHGDPILGLKEVIRDVLAGKYQIDRAQQVDAFRKEVDDYRKLAERGDPRARVAGETLIAGWTNNVRYLCDFAYTIVADTKNPKRDFTLAGQAIEMAERASPTNNTLRLLTTKIAFLFESGRPQEAIGMTKDAIDQAKDPREKAALEPYLRRLEARLKAINEAKARKAASTNDVQSATGTNNARATHLPTVPMLRSGSTNNNGSVGGDTGDGKKGTP